MAPGGHHRGGPAGTEELERDVGVENRLAARPVLDEDRYVRAPRGQRLGRCEDRNAEFSGVFVGAEASAVAERRARRNQQKGRREHENAAQCSIPRMAIG